MVHSTDPYKGVSQTEHVDRSVRTVTQVMQPRVSVIVPTKNRALTLVESLRAVAQSRMIDEVIIVDDGSEEDYGHANAEVRRFFSRERVRYYKLAKSLGSGAARNLGIEAATGEYLFFLDDDVVVMPGYLDQAIAGLHAQKCDVVGGPVLMLQPGESPDLALRRARRAPSDHRSLSRALVDFRTWKGRFDIVGDVTCEVPFVTSISVWCAWPFKEGLRFRTFPGNGYREETDLQLRAGLLGARIMYDGRLVSFHLPRTRGGQWSVSRWRWYASSVSNNWAFLVSNDGVLRKHYALHNRYVAQCLFTLRQTSVLVPPTVRRSLRALKESVLRR
ncbi:glycosyltransferase family 2 protein [Carboxydichorda subterranea]|uniref:glycosyltransferase family 2 protein n=1 Tax=Carboxydichorda subterranea TaxID=3109565 RepID=UPI00385797F9